MTTPPPNFKELMWAIRQGDTAMVQRLVEGTLSLAEGAIPTMERPH